VCQTEWLTDDLLNRIQSNSELCQRLQDPTFMQAINEFPANPQAAMHKYRDNAAMQAFFRDFCALLGLLTSIYYQLLKVSKLFIFLICILYFYIFISDDDIVFIFLMVE